MRRTLTVLVVLCLVTVGFAPAVSAANAQVDGATTTENESSAEETTLTILQYNDIQTAASQDGNFPRLAHLIDERRAAHDNPTVVLGGGDQVSPHSLSPTSQWQTPIDALNAMEPDAEVIGNHDLDFGFQEVENFAAESEFPWLMANVVQADSGDPIPGTEPYEVIEKGDVTVGVIGIADEAIKGKTAVDFEEQGYEVRDHVETTQQYATQLKEEENVDVVVVLGHVGIPESKEIAEGVDEVDAIAVGDDELEYPPEEHSGAVIMEAEGRAEHLNEVNMTIQDGEVVSWNGRMLDVTEDVPKDEEVSSIITEARGDQLSTVLGETDVELDATFNSNYADDTKMGNLITDAFRWKTGADVAITNAGGIRSDSVYGPGEITAGDVYSVLPFGNSLVTVELTGAEIEQLLASQVTTARTGEFGGQAQLQVSGVQYEWADNAFLPAEDRIRNAYVNGEPLDEDETYTVTVNSYMAGWSGSVLEDAPRVSTTEALYGTVTAEYIQDQGTVAPEDIDRIRRVDAEVPAAPVLTNGEDTATAVVRRPAFSEAVDEDSFYVLNESGHRLDAESVVVTDNRLFVRFDDAALQQLAENSDDLQLYGQYVDPLTNDQRVAWSNSVLNADITVVDRDEADGHLVTPTASMTTVTQQRVV
jgi:2',3'-cyclic-nucleotide 2'-phosphodiesterase (5'-nucleotidase family)